MFKKKYLINEGFITNSLFSLLLGIAVIIIFYWFPKIYVYLIAEDSIGEYFTFAGYFVSAIIVIIALIADREIRKPVLFLLALSFFIMAMEEISWGQRILDFKTPENLYLINNQREFNFHNLVFVKYTKRVFGYAMIAWVLVLPVVVHKFNGVKKIVTRYGVPLVPLNIIPYFVISLFFFLFEPLPKSDEINEMLFAFAFLVFSNTILSNALNRRVKQGLQRLGYLCICFICAAGLTGFLVRNYPFYNDLKRRSLEFASVEYVQRGMIRQSTQLFDFLLGNPRLKDNTVLTRYAYFLDKQGKHDIAGNILNDVLHSYQMKMLTHPDDPMPHVHRGRIFYYLKEYEKYQSEYNAGIQKFLARLKKVEDRVSRLEISFTLSSLYAGLQDYQNSMIYYQKAYSICITPFERERLLNRGKGLFLRIINKRPV